MMDHRLGAAAPGGRNERRVDLQRQEMSVAGYFFQDHFRANAIAGSHLHHHRSGTQVRLLGNDITQPAVAGEESSRLAGSPDKLPQESYGFHVAGTYHTRAHRGREVSAGRNRLASAGGSWYQRDASLRVRVFGKEVRILCRPATVCGNGTRRAGGATGRVAPLPATGTKVLGRRGQAGRAASQETCPGAKGWNRPGAGSAGRRSCMNAPSRGRTQGAASAAGLFCFGHQVDQAAGSRLGRPDPAIEAA